MSIETDLKDKINNIKSSNILTKIIYELNNNYPAVSNINYSGRVKNYKSALAKFKTKGYSNVNQMTDIAGIMGVAKSVDEVYKLAEHINNNYEVVGKADDYIKCPKDGYQSYHINIEYQDIRIEIQLKTQDMYRAQTFVHDRIYKNNNILSGIKPDIMKPLFPMITAAPEDTINRNMQDIETIIKNFESVGTVDAIKEVEINLDKIRVLLVEDLNKVLVSHAAAAKEINSKINFIDSNFKRLKEAEYWLGDYEINMKKLQRTNSPLKRVVRKVNKHMREEYNRLNMDIRHDKSFLNNCHVTDRHDFEKQLSALRSTPKDMLTLELNTVSSCIDNILESIRVISKPHNDRSLTKQFDIER